MKLHWWYILHIFIFAVLSIANLIYVYFDKYAFVKFLNLFAFFYAGVYVFIAAVKLYKLNKSKLHKK